MCPLLSCCHRPAGSHRAGPVPTLLYYLQRLLLASTSEEPLTERQRRRLPARLQALWHQVLGGEACHQPGQCPAFLVEQLLPALLERSCCCQAVRERVPLPEALHRGFRGTRRWARQAMRFRRRGTAAGTRAGSR